MKKIISLLFTVGLTLTASAQNRIVQFYGQSFINGCNLVVSNNQTIQYNYTNVPYVSPVGMLSGSYSNISTIYTNTSAGNITNTIVMPGAITDCSVNPDANGNANTNVCILVSLNSTNLFPPARQGSLPNPSNPNNVTNWVPPILINASSTNVLTFTFQRSGDPMANSYSSSIPGGTAPNTFGTGPSDYFKFTMNASNTTQQVYMTNLPASFVAGSRWIRLLSVSTDNASQSPGALINVLKLCGWGP